MANVPSIITLLTDFGTADGYVAEMKGVLLTLAPQATLVDITHDIPAQDVEAARLAVARYWRRFPESTIHIVVVDPGVGSARAPLAIASGGQFLVGPDNGVLSPALFAPDVSVVALDVPATASPTFHGRDVFAPAAARIANGSDLMALGTLTGAPLRRRTPEAVRNVDGSVAGQVITIDRFGNAVTNLVARGGGSVLLRGVERRIVRTYADAADGEVVALTGSSGLLEVAVRNGNAASTLQLVRGSEVVLLRHR